MEKQATRPKLGPKMLDLQQVVEGILFGKWQIWVLGPQEQQTMVGKLNFAQWEALHKGFFCFEEGLAKRLSLLSGRPCKRTFWPKDFAQKSCSIKDALQMGWT